MNFRNLIRFLKDRRGNIAPIFALSLIPTVAMIGAAVDYTRANNIKSAMQSALDATTLSMAAGASGQSAANLTTQATNYFKALFTKTAGTTGVTLTVNYTTTDGPQLVMAASTSVKTEFMNLPGVGIPYIPIAASSTAAWGNTRLRVALALDNTGSMAASSKMTMLKTAAKNLIDQLSAAQTNDGDVYISIIPFAKDVNVGTDLVNNSAWLRFSTGVDTDDSWDNENGTCRLNGNTVTAATKNACNGKGACSLSNYNNNQSSCGTHGTCSNNNYSTLNSCTQTSHGYCSNSTYTSQSQCSSHSATWMLNTFTPATWTGATWTPNDHSTWTGCVMDRDQDHDIDNASPAAGTASTLFPTEQYTTASGCPVQIMPLSNNWANLKTKIDSMTPNGNTNTTIGLEWGWHSLTQGSPLFAPAEDAHYNYRKVIIFLTDGDNTQNRFSSTQSAIDARMTAACTNAKGTNGLSPNDVEIYTILVLQGSASLLSNCASNKSGTTDHYFNITASNQLVSVFNQIGTKLARLHVAK